MISTMHACFYGGGSGSRINKSVAVIRDLTKTMKAMTLKVKGRGGGGRHRHRRRSTAEDEELQTQGKDASSSTSSSAKIAPSQQHDDEERGAEKRHQHCDKCCSPLDNDRLSAADKEEEQGAAPDDDAEEWVAEPEPGVLMTLAPRGDGANYLRRIRFSEEQFPDARAARAWWEDNFDRIVELYSIVVQPMHGEDDGDDPAAPVTPCQSEDDEHQRPDGELEYSASCSASTSTSAGSASNLSGPSSGSGSANKVESPILGLVTEPNGRKRSKRAQHYQKTRQEQ